MLNPEQLAAVKYLDGPLLVLAGAGSGKTSVITQKIAHLLHKGLAAERIAAITFTNKAAREMRERVSKLVSKDDAGKLVMCTFHALGLRLLHHEHQHVGLERNFSVLDTDDTGAIIKELAPKNIKSDALWRLRGLISTMKNRALTPAEALQAARSQGELEAAGIYQSYQARLNAYNSVDFDDLIRLPLKLLQEHTDVRAQWQEKLRYLLVDEYQDTNDAQYQLLKLLAGKRGAFTCVGDDDQSIYAWRGANPENIAQLGADFTHLKVIKLEQNYRCSKRILRAANHLIANNPHVHGKKLWSELPEGSKIRVLECKDSEHEAERVAGIISYLKEKHDARWHQFALLYRGNHQAKALEKALRLARIPYHLSGAQSFLDRSEVKDVLAYLRLVANGRDDAAFLRIVNVPKREIGATTLEKLGQMAKKQHVPLLEAARSHSVLAALPPRSANQLVKFTDLIDTLGRKAQQLAAHELVAFVKEATHYKKHLMHTNPQAPLVERRLANLAELQEWFKAMGKDGSVGDLAGQLALLGRVDNDDPGNQVRLMTLHAAKGLEFRFVFMVGLEDGTLPHEGAIDEGRLEEERRLMYVGMTRAKQMLTLLWAKRVRRYGEILANEPSRFIAELPAEDVHIQGHDKKADAEITKETAEVHLARINAMLGG